MDVNRRIFSVAPAATDNNGNVACVIPGGCPRIKCSPAAMYSNPRSSNQRASAIISDASSTVLAPKWSSTLSVFMTLTSVVREFNEVRAMLILH